VLPLARAVAGGPAVVPAGPPFGPSLSGAATVSLAPGVSVVDSVIKDTADGSSYPITGIGADVIARLSAAAPVEDVVAAISDDYGVPDVTVATDITAFIEVLDRQGLISTRQSYLANVSGFIRSLAIATPSLVDLVMLDTSALAQPTRRYPAKARFVVLACIEAQMILYLTGLVLIGAAVGFKSFEAWRQGVPVLGVAAFAGVRPVLALTIFTVLFVGHELGHLAAITALRMKARSVAVRMWAVGITFVPDTPGKMLAVAVSGPLAGALGALAVAGLLALRPIPQLGIGVTEVTYVLLFGLLHLWSLRPWAQDGKQATNALLSLRRARRRMATTMRGAE
jgi:Coenzyme PQQ synthesis protein D (PqqD)